MRPLYPLRKLIYNEIVHYALWCQCSVYTWIPITGLLTHYLSEGSPDGIMHPRASSRVLACNGSPSTVGLVRGDEPIRGRVERCHMFQSVACLNCLSMYSRISSHIHFAPMRLEPDSTGCSDLRGETIIAVLAVFIATELKEGRTVSKRSSN
jgi:hypothetical protein